IKDGGHASGAGCFQSWGAVLDDKASRWIGIHHLGGQQEKVWRGFAYARVVRREKPRTELPQKACAAHATDKICPWCIGCDAVWHGERCQHLDCSVGRGNFTF